MSKIVFNKRPHYKFTLTESGLAVGPPGPNGLSAYEVAVENGFEGTEEEWLASLEGDVATHENTYDHTKITTSAQVTTGAKSSATDSGTAGDISITDDYIYFCVQTGTAGNAIWKRSVVFST